MAETPEGKVKRQIKAYLKAQGVYFYMPVPSGLGARTLDFLCCIEGRFLGIEAKAPGKKATHAQQDEIDRMAQARGLAICVDNVQDLITYLRDNGVA
jgi:hypothetical protein